MINKIVENCIRDNIIQDSEVEVIRYGLKSLVSNALGFILLAILGAYFGNVIEGIILWIYIKIKI
ncbi:MAG: accessory gene regulator B family protein [Lachnospiraceae bacterium]|nr:accessory gene regulator B family protein [Lachnospiraceae bacterium]